MKTSTHFDPIAVSCQPEDLMIKFEFELSGPRLKSPLRIANTFLLARAQHAMHATFFLGDFEEIFSLLVAKPCKLAVISQIREILDRSRLEEKAYDRETRNPAHPGFADPLPDFHEQRASSAA
jgi:hypothetical protein